MKNLIGVILLIALTGCAVCKSSDSMEVCRTKHRDRDQPKPDFAAGRSLTRVAAIEPSSRAKID
jgi:hypothetical protein